jgi:uncharacterized protein YfbU (UPF0304 family)
MRPTVVQEVYDFLDLWRWIDRAYDHLSSDDQQRVRQATGLSNKPGCLGFDGTKEIEYSKTARFMIEHMAYYGESKDRVDIDTHRPMAETYRRMHQAAKAILQVVSPGRMTADQLISVLQEGGHRA